MASNKIAIDIIGLSTGCINFNNISIIVSLRFMFRFNKKRKLVLVYKQKEKKVNLSREMWKWKTRVNQGEWVDLEVVGVSDVSPSGSNKKKKQKRKKAQDVNDQRALLRLWDAGHATFELGEHRTSPLFTRLCARWLTEDLQTKYALGALDISFSYYFFFIFIFIFFLSCSPDETNDSWLNDFSHYLRNALIPPDISVTTSHARFHLTICLTNLWKHTRTRPSSLCLLYSLSWKNSEERA